MKFQQFYSSSSGNLYCVTSDSGSRLLIECGVPWKKLVQTLGYDLWAIQACLLTHEHLDHSKAVRDVMKAGIDVYANEHTFGHHGLSKHRRAKVVSDKSFVRLGAFHIRCFELHHDVPTLGFVIKEPATNEYLLFAIDSSHINQRFKCAFSIIMLEVSYDKDVLTDRVDTKDIDEELAKRLLTSHMELGTAKDYLKNYCDLSRCTEIHLLHLSQGNIDAEKARQEIESEFFIKTVIVDDESVHRGVNKIGRERG